MRLAGQVLLVTGAGRGLGRAIALRLAGHGGVLAINDIDLEAAGQVVGEIQAAGGRAEAFRADVSRLDEVEAMVSGITERLGPIHVLVNNAAVFAESVPFVEISDEEWDRVMSVNLKGVFNVSKVVARQMLEYRRGCIINVSSFTGKTGRVVYSTFGKPTKAHYCASKAGILSLTKSLAFELAPYGIRVNAVAPGAVENDATPVEKRRLLTPLVPLGRTGTPQDVAAAVCFLVSEDAAFITGEILDVNGGILMD